MTNLISNGVIKTDLIVAWVFNGWDIQGLGEEQKVPEKNKTIVEIKSKILKPVFYIFAKKGPAMGPREIR